MSKYFDVKGAIGELTGENLWVRSAQTGGFFAKVKQMLQSKSEVAYAKIFRPQFTSMVLADLRIRHLELEKSQGLSLAQQKLILSCFDDPKTNPVEWVVKQKVILSIGQQYSEKEEKISFFSKVIEKLESEGAAKCVSALVAKSILIPGATREQKIDLISLLGVAKFGMPKRGKRLPPVSNPLKQPPRRKLVPVKEHPLKQPPHRVLQKP